MDLAAMKNLGSEMKRKLNAVGVGSAEDLAQLGSREAFFRLKTAFPEVCLVHLDALEGAIIDVDFNELPPPMSKVN